MITNWPIESPVTIQTITERVDHSRIAVYDHILGAKDKNSVYMEDIFNVFICLVQQSLHFIIYDKKNEPILSFINDQSLKESFHDLVNNTHWNDFNLFDMFQTDEYPHYRVAIVRTVESSSTDELEVICKHDIKSKVLTPQDYVSVCASLFFSKKWDGFNSYALKLLMSGIYKSLDILLAMKNKKSSPVKGVDITVSKSEHVDHAVGIHEALSLHLKDLNYATRIVGNIQPFDIKSSVSEELPTARMLLCYRAYDVNDKHHKNISDDYSSRYVLSSSIENQFNEILSEIRSEVGRLGWKYEKYHNPEKKQFVYSKSSTGYSDYQSLAEMLDQEFWRLIKRASWQSKYTKILCSKTSCEFNDIVDLVYQTGLIQNVRLLKNYGFERFNTEKLEQLRSSDIKQIKNENVLLYNDLMRQVLIFYVTTRIHSSANRPTDIKAAYLPIKIKGVCWAVALHTYVCHEIHAQSESQVLHHEKNHSWLSYFLCATTVRRRANSIARKACLDYASKHIIKVVSENIYRLPIEDDVNLLSMRMNKQMQDIAAYLPYTFPQFAIALSSQLPSSDYKQIESFDSSNDLKIGLLDVERDGISSEYHFLRLTHNSGNGESVLLVWELQDNIYYNPTQWWGDTKSRSFNALIQFGVTVGRELRYHEDTKQLINHNHPTVTRFLPQTGY